MEVESIAPWAIGPPAPRGTIFVVRFAQVAGLSLMVVWIFGFLGGLRLTPQSVEGGNNTNGLFNWHPLLLTVAFVGFMSEAVLAYKAPTTRNKTRDQKKMWHFSLQLGAAICMVFGIIAAFLSHNLKKPSPIPNLYSPHSVLGLLTFLMFLAQFGIGFTAYLAPKWSLAQRKALGPVHTYLGKSIYVMGLATMAAGIQEKTTFVQFIDKPGVFAAIMRIPGMLQLVLVVLAMAVLYHHAPSAAQKQSQEAGLEAQPLFEDN